MQVDERDRTRDRAYLETIVAPPRRSRRGAIAWALFGVVGLALGAVWAAGIASTGSTVGATNDASPALVAPGAAVDPRFEGVIEQPSPDALPLTITFQAKKGQINTDAQLFHVDLTGDDPLTAAVDVFSGTYFVTVEVPSALALIATGWEQLNLELSAAVGDCTGVDGDPNLAAAPISTVLTIDNSDPGATLTGLTGGNEYCIGIEGLGEASDAGGSFIRKTATGAAPTNPTFVAFISQSA